MQKNIKQHDLINQYQKKGFIAGYASFFNHVDQQRDRIAKGAFTKTLQAWHFLGKMPKMLWQHDYKQPIGVWTHLHEDEKGLYAEGQLTLGVSKADEAYLLLKDGALEGLSIGFRIIESTYDKNKKARVLLDIDLLEISLVTFEANRMAVIHHIKAV